MDVCKTPAADTSTFCDFDNLCSIPCSTDNICRIYECQGDTDGHLSYLQSRERIPSKPFQSYHVPESVLILYSGVAFLCYTSIQ